MPATAAIRIPRLDTRHPEFADALARRLQLSATNDPSFQRKVAAIVGQVRERGDQALLDFVRRYDGLTAARVADLQAPESAIAQAGEGLDRKVRQALREASRRIRRYAERQKLESWQFSDERGCILGQQISPLRSCGLYVPGGQAAYPSTVLMSAIPARIAGVANISMVTPGSLLEMSPAVLYAAQLAGVKTIYTMGGAHAIAALAYGTESIGAVDKIVGPGNAYVVEAKRQVFGHVGIDMLAGPSEILILCDGKTDVEWVTADLFSQAEHDEQARAILVCPDQDFLDAVATRVEQTIASAARADIIRRSLNRQGLLIRVRDLDEGLSLVNQLAPEHLELSVREPEDLLPKISAAGAIFLGPYSCEAVGDYCAGPNHVLPTARSARFASPLGVYDFQKRSSIIHCSAKGARELAAVAACLAETEGLFAHAESARCRQKNGA